MANRPKKTLEKSAGQRPVLQFRVHQDTYDDIGKAAKKLKLTISEEAARRLDRYAEYEKAMGDVKQWLAESRQTVAKGQEAALRDWGYRRIQLDQGAIWAEPGMEMGRMNLSIDAAAIVEAMEPELVAVLARAIQKVSKPKGEQS